MHHHIIDKQVFYVCLLTKCEVSRDQELHPSVVDTIGIFREKIKIEYMLTQVIVLC